MSDSVTRVPYLPAHVPIYVLSEQESVSKWTHRREEAEAWLADNERILPAVDVLMPNGEVGIMVDAGIMVDGGIVSL